MITFSMDKLSTQGKGGKLDKAIVCYHAVRSLRHAGAG
jgi:hypothetical protein